MASTHLSKSASGGSRTTWTISAWVKRSSLVTGSIFNGIIDTSNESQLLFSSDSIEFYDWSSSARTGTLVTSAKYRDVNAWYHIVAVWDTTNATAGDRMRLYVNGEEVTSFSTDTQPSLNQNSSLGNGSYTQQVGLYSNNAGYYFNGSMAHVHFIDGTAYDASTFGETDSTSGVWKPKTAPSVTYGTNGFFLKFANSASLGTDSSGNGNNFTVNGSGTQTLDTPSNVYCTMNPLLKGANVTLSNGNLTCVGSGTYVAVGSTLAVNSGKWYWEAKCNTASPHNRFNVGLMKTSVNQNGLVYPGDNADGYVYANDGYIYTSGSQLLNTGTTVSVGDIVGFLLDLDNGTLKLKKNGSDVYSGNAVISSLNTGDYWYVAQGADVSNVDFNFGNGYFGTTVISSPNNDGAGEGKFAYTVPTGYYALNTKNLKTYG